MLIVSFSMLLEVIHVPQGVTKLLNFKTMLMLISWSFVGKLINNSYQGSLYSILTTPAKASPPRAVEDILQFPGLVVSDMFYTVVQADALGTMFHNESHFSKLHYEIERILRRRGENSSTSRVLRQLNVPLET